MYISLRVYKSDLIITLSNYLHILQHGRGGGTEEGAEEGILGVRDSESDGPSDMWYALRYLRTIDD